MKTTEQLLQINSEAHTDAMREGLTPTEAINAGMQALYKTGLHDAGGGFSSDGDAAEAAKKFLEEQGYYVVKAGGLYRDNARKALEAAGYTVTPPADALSRTHDDGSETGPAAIAPASS